MPGRCAPECHGAPFVIATRNRHFVLGDRHAVQAAWTVAAKYRPLPVRISQLFAARTLGDIACRPATLSPCQGRRDGSTNCPAESRRIADVHAVMAVRFR